MTKVWKIYRQGTSSTPVAEVHDLELHDEWMGECFLTVDIRNAESIDFAVGDYIDYRGERFTIDYDPTVLKKARRGTYGEGFIYDNIKFVNEAQAKVVRCDFTDIVLNDNNIHYTALPTFPFYCETVDDLLDRIQANLEELYPGEFILIGLNEARNSQRGRLVGRQRAFEEAYEEYIGGSPAGSYGNTGVALTVDNITCWDALTKVHEDFSLNFIQRGYVIAVGTAGIFTSSVFRYGKGNGLYEIERVGDSGQQIVTRLRAYGSETNLPTRYYANLNTKIYGTATSTGEGFVSVDVDFRQDYFTNPFSSGETDVKVGIDNVTYEAKAYNNAVTGKIIVNTLTLDAISSGTKVYFVSGVKEDAWPNDHREYNTDNLPDNMAVNRLMLPGFPNQSLHDWVEAHKNQSGYGYLLEMIAAGFEFSRDKYRPYIDSPNKAQYGIRPSSIYFDGSNDTTDIHPTIEGMKNGSTAIDEVYSADTITDNGVFGDGDVPNFKITLPNLGFDLGDVYQDGASIDMKDGMCGARSFALASKPTQDTNGRWVCEVKRAYDDVLDLWFPYNDFQIHTGDHYVLVGITMPDAYVDKASERLLEAAYDALLKNHAPRYTWQPRIDEIWMQRQADEAAASDGIIKALHDTLKAGDVFKFSDEDLGVDAGIIIDILTIKENGNNGIPTYEVTLRDEKQVSTIQRLQNKVDSLANGGNGRSTGSGVGGGSYTDKQIESLIEAAGKDHFLSKTSDDTAHGLIGFLKGVWFGVKNWFIDALGNASLNNIKAAGDVDVDGLLKALRARINNISSTNYSGSGIFEEGFLITNNHNGHSYMEIDELLVRMKATFMELEIRKETYSGGNVFYSPAGSKIYRVEYYDKDGNRLGMTEMEVKVPLTWGGNNLLLKLVSKLGILSRKKIIYVQEEVDMSEVAFFRCYLIADDGTTQTRNWWHENDQARCQTFNRASEKHETNSSDMPNPNYDESYIPSTMDGNRFYWRLVIGTGSKKLEDGKWYDYVDLSNGTVGDGQIANSDIPATGDSIVCVGNRTEEERMNVIVLEVIGNDAPAIKIYRGINTFSMSGRKYMQVSPKKIQLRAGSIEYITDYGEVVPPKVYLGPWSDSRRYHYYEEVSHSGSTWLCRISDGYRWEDASGNVIDDSKVTDITYGNDTFTYTFERDGVAKSGMDRYTRKGKYGSTDVFYVRRYTTVEPSDSSDEWQKETSAGGQGMKGSFKSTAFCRTNQDIEGEVPTGGTYNNAIPDDMTVGGETIGWSDGIPDGESILWSSTCVFYGDGTSSGWSPVQKVMDTADYDVEFCLIDSETPPDGPDPTKPPHSDHSQETPRWYDPELHASVFANPGNRFIWRAERKIKNGAYEGDWVKSRIYGEKGEPGDPAEVDEETLERIVEDKMQAIKDGLTIVIKPQAIIVNQDTTGEANFGSANAEAVVEIYRGDTLASYTLSNAVAWGYPSSGRPATMTNCAEIISHTVKLTGVAYTQDTESGAYTYAYDHGVITFVATVDSKDYNLSVAWFLNRLGNRETVIRGDVEKTVAGRVQYELNSRQVVTKKTFQAEFENSAQGINNKISSIEEIIGEGGENIVTTENVNEIVNSSIENSSTIRRLEYQTRNLIDYHDWRYYDTDTYAAVTEPTQNIYGGDDGDCESPTVYLREGVTYTFSFYCHSQNPNFGARIFDTKPSRYSASGGTVIEKSEIKTDASDRYESETRKYVTFTPPKSGYAIFDVYNITEFYRPMLEVGSEPTEWTPCGSEEYKSQIKQTADRINLTVENVRNGLSATGIDITEGKIAMQADDFTLKNNSGDQTLGVNEKGDLSILGDVDARSLYRNMCICGDNGSCSGGWYGAHNSFLDPELGYYYEYRYDQTQKKNGWFEVGGTDEYDGSANILPFDEYTQERAQYINSRPCTYDAEIILLADRGSSVWANNAEVVLPRATDFPKKLITVYHTMSAGNGSSNRAKLVEVGERSYCFVRGMYADGTTGTPTKSYTINCGQKVTLYSNGTYWIIIEIA